MRLRSPGPGLRLRGRALNVLGEARSLLWEDGYLERESLLHFARRDTGLTDFGSDFDPHLLDVLVESARNDADLSFLGRRAVHDSLGTTLAVRLLFMEARKRHPEIFLQDVLPPIVVMGSPRSGTTLLQNLLALHESYHAVENWELRRPVPLWALDRRGEDRRLTIAQRVQARDMAFIRPADHVHFARPTTPGECIVLMLPTLRSAAFWVSAPLYSYVDELMCDDGRIRYREYLDLLKLLQAAHPGTPLVLKAPEHTAYLARVIEVLPGASIVQTHRDPVRCAVSLMSLLTANHANVVRRLDVRRTAETTLSFLESGVEKHFAARREHAGRVHDVDYSDLVSRPVEVLRGIYERFGVPWPHGHEKKVEAYLALNPKGKHGRHEYSAADFGLTDRVISERLAGAREIFESVTGS
jgi:hypothetical protein